MPLLAPFFCVFLLLFGTGAAAKVHIVYQTPETVEERDIQKQILRTGNVQAIRNVINDNIRLPNDLTIIFGMDDGPLYSSDDNEIWIPYGFIDEVEQRFTRANYTHDTHVSVEDATQDALMHTLFHEIAHALVFMLDIPVLGKEEDAADGLAVVLLIHFFENGRDIAISAADLFDLESEDREEFVAEDFWGEHSLDRQRFYSTLCQVYGSAPEDYAYIVNETGFSADRAELCIEEYENLSHSWFTVLDAHLIP